MPHQDPLIEQVGEKVELSRETDFPEFPASVWRDMRSAPQWEPEANEKNVFDTMYLETVEAYYESVEATENAGAQIAQLFRKWQPLADKFTRHVLRGDPDNPLDAELNWDAEGAGEAIVRPLQVDSFANAQYQQTVENPGVFNIIPDDTQADGSVETATQNEQAWLVIGYAEFYGDNKLPYDKIQDEVNDGIGVRRPIYTRNAMETKQTLKIINRRRGPLPVEPGFDLDIDVDIIPGQTGIDVGLFPLGIEVIRADATEYTNFNA